MASIEDAIERLEAAATQLKELGSEESKALRDAVREATKEATKRIKDEFKEKKAAARRESREAEKAIKEAQSRIEKALGSSGAAPAASAGGKRAPKGLREQQFLDYVKANPGSKLADIARGIGIQASAASSIAKRTAKAGKVVKSDDKRYTVA